MCEVLAASDVAFPLYSFGYCADCLLKEVSACYALCALNNGEPKTLVNRFAVDGPIRSFRFRGKAFENGFCYGALASRFKAMEDNVATWCCSYLDALLVSGVEDRGRNVYRK